MLASHGRTSGRGSTGDRLGHLVVAASVVVVLSLVATPVAGAVQGGSVAVDVVDDGERVAGSGAGTVDEGNSSDNETDPGAARFLGPLQAITSDGLEDRNPDLAGTGDGYVVTWTHQERDKEKLNGREIYYSFFEDGEWTTPRPITSNNHVDGDVSVAFDENTNRGVALWAGIEARIPPNATLKTFFKYLNQTELYYATYDGRSWSPARRLTDNNQLEAQPSVIESDGTFYVTWGNRTLDGQLSLNYSTFENGQLGEMHSQPIPGSPYAVSPGPNGGVRVAAFKSNNPEDPQAPAFDNGTILVYQGADSMRRVERYPGVVGLHSSSLDVSREAVVWRGGANQNIENSIFYGENGRTQNLTDTFYQYVDKFDHTSVTTVGNDGGTLLTFRALVKGNSSRRHVYRVRRDGEWTFTGALNQTLRPNFLFTEVRTAANSDSFGFVFLTRNDDRPNQNEDLLGIVHRFRPDLSMSASADPSPENASVGDDVTVSYSVQNQGDVNLDREFTVALMSGGEVVTSRTHSGLDVADRVNDSFEVTVPENGVMRVVVDPDGEIAETTEKNNVTELPLAGPDMAVINASATRQGSNLTLKVNVGNAGAVTADRAVITFATADPSRDVLGTRTITGVGTDEIRTITYETTVQAVNDLGGELYVNVSTANDIRGYNDAGIFEPLRPEIALVASDTSFERRGESVFVNVSVSNTGVGPGKFALSVRTRSGAPITSTNVSINASPRQNGVVVKKVPVEIPPEAVGKRILLVADVTDGSPRDNSFGIEVPSYLGDTQSPTVQTFEATAKDGTIELRIRADEALAQDSLRVKVSGGTSTVLSGSDFQQSDGGRSYTATVQANGSGTYQFELTSGSDRVGNPARGSLSTQVTIENQSQPTATSTPNGTTSGDGGGGGGGGGLLVPILVALVLVLVLVGGVFVYKIR